MTRLRELVRISYTYSSDSDHAADQTRPSDSQRPQRSSRRLQNYQELSDDNSILSDTSESSVTRRYIQHQPPPEDVSTFIVGRNNVLTPPRKRRRISTRNKIQTISNLRRSKVVVDLSKLNSSNIKQNSNFTNETKGPPWQELPFQILKTILALAAGPLYDRPSRPGPGIEWLIGTSTLCKSFWEASLCALLYSPPLFPSYRAHGIIELLEQDQNHLLCDYRQKIKCLDIDVKSVLVRKSGIDLLRLLRLTPNLSELRFYHAHDALATFVWAQPGVHKLRWSYPEELFGVLDTHNNVLESFEWNGRFSNTQEVLQAMCHMHPRPTLKFLRFLSCLNLNIHPDRKKLDVEQAAGQLNAALLELHNLQHLKFRACDIICDESVPGLPAGLKVLEIEYCQYLTSDSLQSYLESKGQSIEELILNGNQTMSLSFMSNLKQSCPRLQRFVADLSYIDPTSYRDREPLFDELFPQGPPTWPTTLQYASMTNLRNLDKQDAEAFLTSLTESAEELKHLRHLSIAAILKDVDWRDRAEMRRKWLGTLEETFLREEPPPPVIHKRSKIPKRRKTPNGRQSSRIAETDIRRAEAEADQHLPMERSHRRKGLCKTVYFVLSDQRPAQEQFHENDFLDSEPSDDREWTG